MWGILRRTAFFRNLKQGSSHRAFSVNAGREQRKRFKRFNGLPSAFQWIVVVVSMEHWWRFNGFSTSSQCFFSEKRLVRQWEMTGTLGTNHWYVWDKPLVRRGRTVGNIMLVIYEISIETLKRKGRVSPPWMFSQRNNPYCDLLKISAAKIKFLVESAKCFERILYFCDRITKNWIIWIMFFIHRLIKNPPL